MPEHLKNQIERSLGIFLEIFQRKYIPEHFPPSLYTSMKEYILRGGKRLRPALLVLSYQGYRAQAHRVPSSIYKAAVGLELMHNFMLIHDDLIDRSHLRRGKPTLHRVLAQAVKTQGADKLGHDLSLVIGDIICALATEALLEVKANPRRKEAALKYFNETTVHTALGEYLDTLHGMMPISQIAEQDVFLNYSLKTARYTFQAPLIIGAILAGADKKELLRLSELGLAIGQAFQIQDDIIGIFGTQKDIGKSLLSDFVESKKTILVCHAYGQLQHAEKKIFLRYFHKAEKSYKNLLTMRKIFIKTGSLEYALRGIQERLSRADDAFSRLRMRPSCVKQMKKIIEKLFHPSLKIAKKYHFNFPI